MLAEAIAFEGTTFTHGGAHMLARSVFSRTMSMSHLALATLALFVGAAAAAPAAKAAILSIPAVGFIQQCPCGHPPVLDHGVLKPTQFTKLYAAVDFPTNGQKICGLSLVYQDINNNDAMTAQ